MKYDYFSSGCEWHEDNYQDKIKGSKFIESKENLCLHLDFYNSELT